MTSISVAAAERPPGVASAPAPTIRRMHELPGDWLRFFLSATPPRRRNLAGATADEIDWAALTRDASAHAVSVLLFRRLKDAGLESRVPADVLRAWEADALHARLQAVLQRRDALAISQALAARGIRHAFFKGFSYRDWLYDPGWVRIGADLDLLIPPRAVELVREVMISLGFVQSASTIDYRHFRRATWREIRETEVRHYELAQFVKSYQLTDRPDWLFGPDFSRRAPFTFEALENGLVFHSIVDVHWALHFSFARETPLAHVVWSEGPQGRLPRLSTGWSLFTTLFKLYFEAFSRPYYGFHHLVDLAAMLRTPPGEEDWAVLADLVRRYGLQAAAFYTLSAAESLAGESLVPPPFLEEWSITAPDLESLPEGVEKHTFHTNLDLGDFVPYMTGKRIPSGFPVSGRTGG